MEVRVTQQTVLHRALSDTQRLTAQLATLQSQAATGKRLSSVSDDPAASLAILASSAQDRLFAAHLDNIQTARTALNTGVATLQEVSSVFTQAKSIAIEAANAANDENSFEALATQVDGLIEHLLNLANTRHNDIYLFGGAGARTQPFDVTQRDAEGRPLTVQYQTADAATYALVDQRQAVAIYLPGDDVFMARSRQAATFTGNTGAQPGAGTDSATAQTRLLLQHTATTFAPGSGVQPGAGSAAGDTILGLSGTHRLHITDTSGTGAAGTVSLDGGPAIAFTSADANLRVTNAAGDAVYLDMTAITAAFDGDVDIAADGAMSIDGGASWTPLSFDANQYALDSQTGAVVFVDTTLVERTGTETVDHPGTSDAFQTLIALRDDLRNVHNRSSSDQITSISAKIADLDRVRNSVLSVVGEQSASLQSFDSLESHLQDMQTEARKNVSELGDVNLSELVVKLQAYQQMLQLSLATFARIQEQSLVDFLR